MSAKELTSNLSVTTTLVEKILWRNGLHLINDVMYIFASNLVDFLNNFIFSKSIRLTEDDNATISKDNCINSFDSSDEVKHNNSIDYNNNVVSYESVI